MKISCLINKLQELQEIEGDIEVGWYDNEGCQSDTRFDIEVYYGKPHPIKPYNEHIVCPVKSKWIGESQRDFNKQKRVKILNIRGV